jgi:ATP-dependent Clp protease ATP-binding subunit ClpA
VELRLKDLRGLLSDRKISLELTDTAKDLLATQTFNLNCGARPLRRAVQRQVQDPLALQLLHAEVLPGDHIVVDADQGGLRFIRRRGSRAREGKPAAQASFPAPESDLVGVPPAQSRQQQ